MKLRLQSNSIRLRLKRGEVDQLAKIGRVEEAIILGSTEDDLFVYAIDSSRDDALGQLDFEIARLKARLLKSLTDREFVEDPEFSDPN